MSNKHNDPIRESELINYIKSIPEVEPPVDFSRSVMRQLGPKKIPLWRKVVWWFTNPVSVSFSPAKLAGGLTAAALLIMIGFYWGADSSKQDQSSAIRFIMNDPAKEAQSVSVIGSFNNWKPEGGSMRYDAEAGYWILESTLPPGNHEYSFLIDGKKIQLDPRAPMIRDDGFGNRNSMILVSGNDEQHI